MYSCILATQSFIRPNVNQKRIPSCSRRLYLYRSASFFLRCSTAPLLSTSSVVTVSAIAGSSADSSAYALTLRIHRLSDEFKSLPEPIDRVKRFLFYAADLPPFPDGDRIPYNRVMGCTAQVWLSARIDVLGRMHFAADSDSEITRGFCACLLSAMDGARPEEVLAMRAEDLADLNIVGVAGGTQSRVNTWHNVLVSMKKKARALIMTEGEGRPVVVSFPSLVIGGEGVLSGREVTR